MWCRRAGELSLLTIVACGGPGESGTPTVPSSAVATTLSINAGDAQTTFVGSAVSIAPSVIVRDQHGTVVAGVAVVFSITAGGGSLIGAAQTTNVSGVATLGAWTLGSSAGLNAIEAKATGISATVAFTATAVPRTLT